MKSSNRKTCATFLKLVGCLLLQCLAVAPAACQIPVQAGNVRFEVSDGLVIIRYDLPAGDSRHLAVSVTLKKEKDSTFIYHPKDLSGDYGEGNFSGPGRKIAWNITKEFPHGLAGNDYYFVITVVPLSSSSKGIFVWLGAAVAGGVTAAVLLTRRSSQSAASAGDYPSPPGRP